MAHPDLVLWGEARFESPYVFSTYVALREKGLPFRLEVLSLQAGEHRRGDYPSRSLTGRVPALQHGDFWLSESSAIDEYLEDAFPPPTYPALYPASPRERARGRQVQAWLRSDLLPLRQERPTSSVFAAAAVAPLSPAAQDAAGRLVTVADALLPATGGALFERFTIVDADLALMLQRLVANGDAVPPRLAAYAQGVWTRPSVRDWLARARPRP